MTKLYAGPAAVDELLREVVPPLVGQAIESDAADRWFFVRYTDPDHHLRLRFHGRAALLHAQVLPAVEQAIQPLVDRDRIWRIQVDTYEREVERYGGPDAIDLAERIFFVDSEAVVEILGHLDEGDAGEEERWRLALCGADRILTDFGFDFEEKRAIAGTLRGQYGSVPRVTTPLRLQLARKYRVLSKELALLLAGRVDADHPLRPGFEILHQRSARLAPLIRELVELEKAGRVSVSRAAFAESVVHMHLNRLLRSAQNAQEVVIYDFLGRAYASAVARHGIAAR